MSQRGLIRAVALAVSLMLAASSSASALTWSDPQRVSPGQALNAVACPSLSFCAAVGDHGGVVLSSDATGMSPHWQGADVDGSNRLLSVSCPSSSLCVATDNHSRAVSSTDPFAGPSAWGAAAIDPGRWINAISCPTTRLCVAADRRGGMLSTRNPRGGRRAWKRVQVSPVALTAVSCPSIALCVATEKGGRVVVSRHPTGGAAAWHAVRAFRPPGGFASLRGVSCPTVHDCVAAGIAVTDVYSARTQNPIAARSWPATYLDGQPHVGDLHAGLSCGSPGLCVVFDGSVFGTPNVFASIDSGRSWSAETLPASVVSASPFLSAVSCAGTSLCVIVDRSGEVIVGK